MPSEDLPDGQSGIRRLPGCLRYAPASSQSSSIHNSLRSIKQTIQSLYNNLKKPDVQADIALHYGVAKIGIFQSYFETIRKARNMCAHGNVLFDTKLPQRLPHGPAGNLTQPNNSKIFLRKLRTEKLEKY